MRLRRVCSATNWVTTEYMRAHPELAPEMEINEQEKSFTAFLDLGIGTKKLYLNNVSGYMFYQKDSQGIAKFLGEYGQLIEHLRLEALSVSIFGKEWDFLEALMNLKGLQAKRLDGLGESKRKEGETAWRKAQQQMFNLAMKDPRFADGFFPFPSPFKTLKSVDIGQEPGTWPIVNISKQTINLLQMNSVLDQVKLPFNPHMCMERFDGLELLKTGRLPLRHFISSPPDKTQAFFGNFVYSMRGLFDAVIEPHIKDRVGTEEGNLKFFDFKCYHDSKGKLQEYLDTVARSMFGSLCKTCNENDVQLKNVSAFWFPDPSVNRNLLGYPVVSMINLNPCVFPYLMPNLTRIEIRSTKLCSVGSGWRQQRPEWENLKSLDISVDSKLGVVNLFQFFFKDVRRLKLTELRLKFLKDADQMAVPKCDDIVASCPNLKKIAIINWPGTNKALVNLWNGLRALEEVALEGCRNVGNVTFVGEDINKPVFFGLKRLRKLSLLGLDKMPKITDRLFSLVIQHLSLTHFNLTSDAPIESVTLPGIQCLLNGSFAEYIEKFPFGGWSLANVSSEEFKKLEQMFRSYDMR